MRKEITVVIFNKEVGKWVHAKDQEEVKKKEM